LETHDRDQRVYHGQGQGRDRLDLEPLLRVAVSMPCHARTYQPRFTLGPTNLAAIPRTASAESARNVPSQQP